MYWIINDNIEFRPGEKKLISANNPEMNVTLTTPASRCLQLLLEASPEVVLQQDFFKKVWEEEGMLVPTNTLYQNISIIRRGLRAVGETDRRLIATIPRKGFQIDSNVKISRQTETEAMPAHITNSDNDAALPVYLPGENALSDTSADEKTSAPFATQPSKQQNVWQPGWILSALILFIFFVAGIFIMHFIWHLNNEPDFFDSYALVTKENGCHFYSKDDAHDNDSLFQKNKALIKKSGLSCQHYPWIYFPTTKTSPTLAALVCKNKITTTDAPGCISLYFRGVNSE